MYPITHKPIVDKLTKRVRAETTIIKTSIIQVDDKKNNVYKDAVIYDDIPVDKLMEYDNCVVIYSKSFLDDEFIQIVELFGYFPKKKNQDIKIVEICFNYKNKNIILATDPNDLTKMNYKTVQQLCIKNNIDFENQSYSKLIKQLKEKFFNSESIRHKFTCTEREQLYNNSNKNACVAIKN